MVRKWDELTQEQRCRALDKNVPLLPTDTTYTNVSKEVAFIQLVSTGPYYFDKEGNVYTGPAVKQCPLAKDTLNRVWKHDYKTNKMRVVSDGAKHEA